MVFVLLGLPPISHLLFVDDLLIFTRATIREAQVVRQCLAKYAAWSGQYLNVHKSSVNFSQNSQLAVKHEICSILNLRQSANPSKHLGVPIIIGPNKRRVFSYLVDKVTSQIDGWKAKLLSQAGRTVLIKVVASSLSAYTMSHFLLPKAICSHLALCSCVFGGVFRMIKGTTGPANLGLLFAFPKMLAVLVLGRCGWLIKL